MSGSCGHRRNNQPFGQMNAHHFPIRMHKLGKSTFSFPTVLSLIPSQAHSYESNFSLHYEGRLEKELSENFLSDPDAQES